MFGSWSYFWVAINIYSKTEERIRDELSKTVTEKEIRFFKINLKLKFLFLLFAFFFFIKHILFWAARSVALNPTARKD